MTCRECHYWTAQVTPKGWGSSVGTCGHPANARPDKQATIKQMHETCVHWESK